MAIKQPMKAYLTRYHKVTTGGEQFPPLCLHISAGHQISRNIVFRQRQQHQNSAHLLISG